MIGGEDDDLDLELESRLMGEGPWGNPQDLHIPALDEPEEGYFDCQTPTCHRRHHDPDSAAECAAEHQEETDA